MNLRDLINSLRVKPKPAEQLSDEAVLGFLRVLETVDKEEITCNELYEHLDQYVEREVDAKDAAQIMPLMREHLDLCPDCCEEYEALLHVVEESDTNTSN